ncbi:ribosomal protein S24/S35 [Trifolium pratense]|uniref:Ribosomal protein S24/S35 n=1 Tax=Trifolium pratense TaxID=57577 RepID=A0A2K3MQL1_TRIPR|nr:ribosomal protein S24/S35 [Trifolium pratense]
MRRFLLKNASLYTRNLLHHSSSTATPLAVSSHSRFRLFSSDDKPAPLPSTIEKPVPAPSIKESAPIEFEDVSNKDFKAMIEKYYKGDETMLPAIMEAVLKRRLSGKHEDTDDELMHELFIKPIDDVADEDFEEDFEEMHETDEEIDDLYNARDHVMKKMVKDPYFNMDEKKWDDIVQDGIKHGFLMHTKECEDILEDMGNWDKLLPDDIKQKVETKFNELGDMCERGELEPEVAAQEFKKFEDELVLEYLKKAEEEAALQPVDNSVPDEQNYSDDPPGEGPILRWQSRVVFAPGGDAWHPKNRKVKLSVTVKELGLSKYQFRRLRELVGKRYHPGRDELTITSERFEHREENRKDCLRTLLSLIEEAGKANKLVDDARTSYVKGRLQGNPDFMARLHAKSMKLRESNQVPA